MNANFKSSKLVSDVFVSLDFKFVNSKNLFILLTIPIPLMKKIMLAVIVKAVYAWRIVRNVTLYIYKN